MLVDLMSRTWSPMPGGSSTSTTVTPPSMARTAFTLRPSRLPCQNMILVMKNAIPSSPNGGGVAARIAAQTLAKRSPDYESEVRRLLDAALEVIAKHGTAARARVADIVAAAGLSNDAFYRHFPSKDALVCAIIEDGTQRLASYVA